jgi:hypothetical protein
MASRPAWLFWVRSTLLSAICGHAIANALFDADEYHHAGLSFSWSAFIPMTIQAFVVIGAWWGLGRIRWRPRPTSAGSAGGRGPHPSRRGISAGSSPR